MDLQKCMPSGGASVLKIAPIKFKREVDEIAQSPGSKGATGHAVETDVDIDLREVYFLIMHFLSAGPCQRTCLQFWNELLEHRLLPRRYHAWYSRDGLHSGNVDDDGISFPLNYNKLVDRYPHIGKDHLVKLLRQLMLSTAHPLHGQLGGSTPNAADVPTLLGYGSFSLLDADMKVADKQVKPLPVYLRWPHMQANQVQGLNLREIGGGFSRHHRAPSIRSACYAIVKPSTMVQRMQNIKKLRGHRVAVYCAIFDRSGRYVISGSDDRLVKIWSMETAFCLASCRGHEGDITDLAVSSNNALVASASNDFVIRVWRLPDGMPLSVLRGHTGSVNTVAFSPRSSAMYQLLSSSDDGTCRIWDARYSQCNPRIYLPRPSDVMTGKNNGPPTNLPLSNNGQQRFQILCCAYNANGTCFVTGSSDTFARVWSALKSNSDDSEQSIHEMDLLSGHENDVNYVQFSGCAVASKFSTSDSLKEENIPKFRNSWFCHDNIVTCSRDGSAIIWVPKSRRSHGKVGRWTRAYHLKVPPPPLPPQPPRGGPRKRFLPTPRGVNMIVWSLDNRFVLAAIMDCRICVWNAVDGSLVHSLTGHTESSYVLDVHPFNPRIAMSAGYDGRTIVWDIWEGEPIQTYEIGRFKLVDGKFSPDGTSIVLSDDVGQIYLLNTGQGESQKDAQYDQFFLGDYRPLIRDAQENVLDQDTQLPPHRRNIQDPLCDASMVPYPEPYQSQYQQRRLGALGIEWRPSLIKYAVRPDYSVGLDEVIPLADLERNVEPLPEFIDAMYMEPEIEVVSDDNDSEYNANEDNSSEAEQRGLSDISSSDLEGSEDDSQVECSNRDGLRRSRRKKSNVGVELKTAAGRHIRKRNLDECDGAPSGCNRAKKIKNSRKSSKRNSSKAKNLRPQRIAARNARNMFSQITNSSTDLEDENDSEDESSDSLKDSDIFGESERKMQLKCEELKQPPLVEFADVAQRPAISESQANGGSRRKLVLKFSLRDSKKNVPLEDTSLCQSSGPQEDAKKSVPDSFVDPALSVTAQTNAELLQNQSRHYHPDKEQIKNTMPADADTTFNGFGGPFEHSSDGRSEHFVTGELETVGSMTPLEIPHLDDALKSSSFESSLPSMHLPNGDASMEPGSDKLIIGGKDQSRTSRCTGDLQERNEVDHSSNSNDFKLKAPMNSTKLIIKKKQVSGDEKCPYKLKLVSSRVDLTGVGRDLNTGNSSFMEPNQVMEVPEEDVDKGNFRSMQLSHSYLDKTHVHTHQRGRSNKEDISPEGFGDDMDESTPMCRTGSVRIKTTSKVPNAFNLRIKVQRGQSSGETSNPAESSLEVSDQLLQRSKPTRNKQGGNFDKDPCILTRRMSSHPVKKLSWLMLSEHEEGYRYIPQLGDEVIYLSQGHQEYLDTCQSFEMGRGRSTAGASAVEICRVEDLDYATSAGSGDSCCKLKLKFVDPSSKVFGKSLRLTLPELIDFPDFVVEKTWYDTAMRRNWSPGDKCMVWWKNEVGEGGSWWEGQILASGAKSPEFPDSPWERYLVQYKTEITETHRHSPWELYDHEVHWDHTRLDREVTKKLQYYLEKVYYRDNHAIQELNRAAAKSDFLNRFPVPLYPDLILSRVEKEYYRSMDAVKHDIKVMLLNAEQFFTKKADLLSKIRRLQDWFKRKLERM